MQVLQEYFVGATSKLRLDAATARRKVQLLCDFDLIVPEAADVLAAIDLHRLHKLSFWDGLVVRAARQGGCKVLLTEGMQHGQIDGIRVVNPFI